MLDFDSQTGDCFEKCLNLKVLKLNRLSDLLSFYRIPALSKMTRLSKLTLSRVKILTSSLVAFEDLSALNILELSDCSIKCNWRRFGVSLGHTPVKNITFENITVSRVDDMESLLDCVQLDYLYVSNFTFSTRQGQSQIELFQAFATAFHCKRKNPRIAFLFEQNDYARNHNGAITDALCRPVQHLAP